ncbi:MAG: DMT family transporter [Bdellovibrionota bacterium]
MIHIAQLKPKTAQGQGGLYLALSAMSFLVMSVFVKFLDHIPVQELVVFRSLVSIVICIFFIRRKKRSPWGVRKKMLVLRGVLGSMAMFLLFVSLHLIPLATTTVLVQTAPIFTLLIGIPLLHEKPIPIQWVFFSGAIVGVVLVKGFDQTAPWTHYLPAFGSAMIAGVAHNLVRELRKTEHAQVIIFYLALTSLSIFFPWAAYTWVWPTQTEWLFVLSLGLFMQLGQYLMTRAYATAPMAAILHFSYVGVVAATIIGYVFFAETLPWLEMVGIFMIISCMYLANRVAKLQPTFEEPKVG